MPPPRAGPGITHLASTPAMSPITISAIMPMRFHLPRIHYSPTGRHSQAQYNRCRTCRYYCPSYPPLCTHKHLWARLRSGQQSLQRRPHESQGEEQGGAVEQRVDLASPTAGEFDQDVGDKAEAYAVRDVEGQRQRQDGQECRDGLVETLPRDEPHGGHHQEPDHYEGGGGHGRDEQRVVASRGIGYRERAAEDRDQGRERQGEQEEEPDDHAGHAGPSSFGHPRPALYIARYRARAHASAEDGGQRVDQQDALGLRHLALLLVDELAFLGHGEHRPHGVEEVCHEQGEDHRQQRELQDLPHGENPAPDGRGVEVEVDYPLWQRHDPEDHPHDARYEDPDYDGAPQAARHEHQCRYEPEGSEQDRALREVAEGQVGLGIGHDEPGVLQADERNEQPDSDGDRELEREGYGVEHRLSQVRQDEHGDEHAFDHDDGHRLLPAQTQAQDEGKGHDGVQAEPRGEGQREVRHEAHRYARHRGSYARREKHPWYGEARTLGSQYRRVDEDYVSHRHKGGEPSHHLRAEVRSPLGELEEGAQSLALPSVCQHTPALRPTFVSMLRLRLRLSAFQHAA